MLSQNFRFTSVSGPVVGPSDLGPLAGLVGTWHGTGLNQIWRPFFQPGPERFLQLNETIETLVFTDIPGDVPNRGLFQPDINLHGVTYIQQILDAHLVGSNGYPAGIHVEPGVWLSVPATTSPAEPATVARLASVPHGASFVAQGVSSTVAGPPTFADVSINPFGIGRNGTGVPFPEQTLATPSAFRTPAADIPNITQALLDNLNLSLTAGIAGKNITSTTILDVSSVPLHPPDNGGGTAGIAFLNGAATGRPNAQVAQIDAKFCIETITDDNDATILQLQYSQRVLLNFNGISWPHISVATLEKA